MTATAIAQLQFMTAAEVCAAAPLGAIIRYTDLAPEPPLRFKNKHAVWRRSNAQGRLISVTPGENGHPGHFTLHEGDFGTGKTVILYNPQNLRPRQQPGLCHRPNARAGLGRRAHRLERYPRAPASRRQSAGCR